MVGRSPLLPRADPHLAVYVIGRPLGEARQRTMIACMKSGQLMSRQPKVYFLCLWGCLKITQSAGQLQSCSIGQEVGEPPAILAWRSWRSWRFCFGPK